MAYRNTVGTRIYLFDTLKELLAKASPARAGDQLAGIAADTEEERMIAKMTLADVELTRFLEQPCVP